MDQFEPDLDRSTPHYTHNLNQIGTLAHTPILDQFEIDCDWFTPDLDQSEPD